MISLKQSLVARFPLIRWLRYPRRIFLDMHGYAASLRYGRPVNANGQPLPWYTYPAIEQLAQYDFSNQRVLEFGGGYSTLYWGARAREVLAIEHDPAWHAEIVARLPANCRMELRTTQDSYCDLTKTSAPFDVAVIDGVAGWRLPSTRAVCALPQPPGLVILDNSDWFVRCAKTLRDSGYFQVDFNGLGPINAFTWTTSLFFHRNALPDPARRRDPQPIGGAQGRHLETDG